MIPIFRGLVSKGTLNNPGFYSYLKSFEGKEVEVVVRTKKEKRSDPQNRYYWGVVIEMLSHHTGYSRDEMHDALREKFLGMERDENGLVMMKSSARLTTDEFAQYVNNIVRWAAEKLGLYIPDPSRVEY